MSCYLLLFTLSVNYYPKLKSPVSYAFDSNANNSNAVNISF